MKKFYSLAIFAIVVNLLITVVATAQTNTWDGSSSSNWNTGANWSLNHVPTSSEDVVIPNGITTTITVNTAAFCKSFTMSGGGSSNTVSISSNNSLTVTNGVSIGAGTGNGDNKVLAVGSGSLSCASITITATGSFLRTSSVTLSTGTVTVSGNITMGSTDDDFTFTDAGTLNVGGTMSGGTFTASTGTVNYNGASAQVITNYSYYNLTLSGGGAKTLGGDRTITGNLLIDAGTTLTLGSNDLTINVNANRTATISGILDINGTGVLAESNSGTKTLIISNGGVLRLSNTNSTFPLLNAQTLNTGSTVEYSASNSGGGQTITNVTYSNLTLGGTGAKNFSGARTVNGTLSIQGTASATGTSPTFGANSTLEYKGSAVQTTTNVEFPSSNSPRSLTIDNINGVTLHAARSINGVLTLTSGVLTTTSSFLLTLNDNATSPGGSNLSYVNGPMKKVGDDEFIFPVGKSGVYGPIGISAPGVITDAFTAEYFRAVPPNQGTYIGGLFQISGVDYWRFDRNTGASNVNITLNWSVTSADAAFPGMYGAASTVARHNGTFWSNYSSSGGHTGTDIAGGGTVTWNGSPYYNSYYTIGLAPAGGSALPVMFANVKAYAKNSGVQIDWSNLTERDLTGYVVERSADGMSFADIAQYQPKSNMNDKADYSSFDANPVAGANFYRIKATEIGGKIIYSKILRVEMSGKQGFTVYPNPVIGKQLTINLTGVAQGSYNVRIINANGQDVYRKMLINSSSSTSEMIELPAAVKPGVYTMLISGDNFNATKMFVVQ